jgi:acyl-CoA dehydrogenase
MRATVFEDEHEQLRTSCARWVATGPSAQDCLASAAGAGLLGLTVPTDHGGQGADLMAAVVLAEELGAAPAVAALVLEHGEVALPVLAGSEAVDAAVLQRVVDGTAGVAVADGLTEADGRLTGTVDTVAATPLAGVMAVAGEGPGASVWWVDAGADGLQVSPLDLIGAMPAVRVVADAATAVRVGGADEALRIRRRRLVLTAAAAASGAEVVGARSRTFAGQREAFGRPIMAFQALRHELVDAATEAAAARALAHAAAESAVRADADVEDALRLCGLAALAATSAQWRTVDLDVQVHGGMGYAMESMPAREWAVRRAGRLLPVPEDAMAGAAAGPGPLVWEGVLATPELRDLRARARAFLDREVVPNLPEWSAEREFPRSLFRTVGADGWIGLKFDAPTPGEGLLRQAVWIEELARCGSGGLAADLGASSDLAAMYLHRAGDDDQRKRWLEPTITGDLVGALAITEPGTGSDVAGITTRARRDGDGWRIDGAKVFITNGPWADYLVVAATVSPDDGGGATPHGQITLFAVDGEADGVTRRRLSMLGWNLSHTGELTFDAVRVGDEARLGDIGSGFGHIVANFAWERVSLAIGGVIAAEAGLRHFGDHAPVGLLTRVAAARALTEQALRLTVRQADGIDDGADTLRAVAMAKLATQTLAVEVLDAAIQHVGVAALERAHPLQRWLRDARLGPIGGGTDQIMREIIGKTW